jgi:HK97 family phage portal protein
MGNYLAKGKFRLYKKQKQNGKIYLYEVYDHPFLDLWSKPNEFQTTWEVKYYTGVYLAVFGNLYLLVLKSVLDGKPRALIMLDPSRVEPISSKTNYVDYYEYNLGSEKVKLSVNEIIHFRFPSRYSIVKGSPILDELRDVIETDKLQQRLTKDFYEKGGFLGATFTTNASLGTQAFERARKQLMEKYQGSENAFKVALFEQGLQPIKAAYSIRDMDLTNQRKLVQEEILMAFRIPKLLMGASAEGYTKASAEAAEYTYAQSMIDPLLGYMSEVLTDFVKKNYGADLVVKHDSVAPKDVERNLNYYKGMMGIGAITINEVRAEEDFEPLEYELADVNILNLGGAAIRLDTGEQLGAVPSNRINSGEQKTLDEEVKLKNELSEELIGLHYKQYSRRFDLEVSKFKYEVDKFFTAQKERLLNTLNLKNLNLLESFFENEFQIILNMIENAYMRFLERGMNFVGIKDINSSFVRDTLQKLVKSSEGINETTKNEILKAIQNADEKDLRNIIENKYKEFSANRSEKIASTTFQGGFNAGLFIGYKLKGYKSKVWVSMNDSEVRSSHRAAHGQEKPIEEPFEVGGALMMYPGDPTAPPEEVINCRCVILGKEK